MTEAYRIETLDSCRLPDRPGSLPAQITLGRVHGNDVTPFATWQSNVKPNGLTLHYWGHYFQTLEEARGDFITRCAREGAAAMQAPVAADPPRDLSGLTRKRSESCGESDCSICGESES